MTHVVPMIMPSIQSLETQYKRLVTSQQGSSTPMNAWNGGGLNSFGSHCNTSWDIMLQWIDFHDFFKGTGADTGAHKHWLTATTLASICAFCESTSNIILLSSDATTFNSISHCASNHNAMALGKALTENAEHCKAAQQHKQTQLQVLKIHKHASSKCELHDHENRHTMSSMRPERCVAVGSMRS